jgi:hypothetical protein
MDKPMGELVAACRQALEALRLIRDHVGDDTLHAIPGWSRYDAIPVLESALTKAAENDDEVKAIIQEYKDGLLSEPEYDALIDPSDDKPQQETP